MPESVRIAIEDRSQTAEARRIARGMAEKAGFDANQAERVAIVVTEACTNLLKHASGGEVLVRTTGGDGPGGPLELEVLALDKGPGMTNLDQCLKDGFSTSATPGQGLGAIVRLTTASDFYSESGRGTAVLARWTRKPDAADPGFDPGFDAGLRTGAVNVCKPGQEVCGDSWGAKSDGDDFSIMVADGLGHGLDAKMASLGAVRMLHQHPDLAPGQLLERAHGALRSTRGAAVAVARIDRANHKLIFAGVGNISAQIYSGGKPSQHLVSVNGTAGHQVQRIREFVYPWPSDGMLVMHSDGLGSQAGLEKHPGLALRDASLIAGVMYRDFTRRNDDATVVVTKAA